MEAYERANTCMENRQRDEWLKAAALWEAIARQYEMLLRAAPDAEPATAEDA